MGNFQKSMSEATTDSAALAPATAIASRTGSGSAGPSRTTSPPVISAAPAVTTMSVAPIPIISSTASTPLTELAINALAQLVKTSKMNRARAGALVEKPEVQTLIDKDIFLIQSDRRTKMTPIQQLQLVRALAQFFLERVDDGHRYNYFEAIFLGKTDEPVLHEYRISVMYQLVSFSLQYPVLPFMNHVMTWLCQMKQEDLMIQYSDRLIDMVVEHFIRNSNEKNRTYEFLIPLEETCSEFCALFIARASLQSALNPAMIDLFVRYSTRNMDFILRHLRDTPWLANDFAGKVFPKLVEKVLVDESSDSLASCLCYFMFRWHHDVLANAERTGAEKRIEILDLLLSSDFPWTKRRSCMLASAISASSRSEDLIRKQLRRVVVPDEYKPVIERLCGEDVKNNSQNVMDSISEMHLDAQNRPK